MGSATKTPKEAGDFEPWRNADECRATNKRPKKLTIATWGMEVAKMVGCWSAAGASAPPESCPSEGTRVIFECLVVVIAAP